MKFRAALSRPGSRLILVSAPLLIAAEIFGLLYHPSAPVSKITSQNDVTQLMAATVVALILCGICLVGFLKYAPSKGYSAWIGAWLFFGHVPGLIAMLLLPDRSASESPS